MGSGIWTWFAEFANVILSLIINFWWLVLLVLVYPAGKWLINRL